jgi:hypothetical protein
MQDSNKIMESEQLKLFLETVFLTKILSTFRHSSHLGLEVVLGVSSTNTPASGEQQISLALDIRSRGHRNPLMRIVCDRYLTLQQ